MKDWEYEKKLNPRFRVWHLRRDGKWWNEPLRDGRFATDKEAEALARLPRWFGRDRWKITQTPDPNPLR